MTPDHAIESDAQYEAKRARAAALMASWSELPPADEKPAEEAA